MQTPGHSVEKLWAVMLKAAVGEIVLASTGAGATALTKVIMSATIKSGFGSIYSGSLKTRSATGPLQFPY